MLVTSKLTLLEMIKEVLQRKKRRYMSETDTCVSKSDGEGINESNVTPFAFLILG